MLLPTDYKFNSCIQNLTEKYLSIISKLYLVTFTSVQSKSGGCERMGSSDSWLADVGVCLTSVGLCRPLLTSSSSRGQFLFTSDSDRPRSLQTRSRPSRPFSCKHTIPLGSFSVVRQQLNPLSTNPHVQSFSNVTLKNTKLSQSSSMYAVRLSRTKTPLRDFPLKENKSKTRKYTEPQTHERSRERSFLTQPWFFHNPNRVFSVLKPAIFI